MESCERPAEQQCCLRQARQPDGEVALGRVVLCLAGESSDHPSLGGVWVGPSKGGKRCKERL